MTGLEQIGIAVFGVTAIRLSQDNREKVRRWACIAGLFNHQWGIFALSFFYTWAWLKGVRTYWWRAAA